MTSEVGRRPAPVAPTITGPSLFSRIYGFGSIYGKTMRDSRRAVIAISLVMGLGLVAVSYAIVQEFNTPRVAPASSWPSSRPSRRSSQGLAGKAVNVGTLGGYLQYKYGVVLPDHRQPLGDPRAVRRRSPRRHAAAASSSSPRAR